jgi:3-(3-hydroxy-phenyl)propionate hydroxylase
VSEEDRTIVVGAGPVGLSAAIALRSLDIPVTVIEAGAADRVRPGSRAIFIHGASMKLLDGIYPDLGMQLADHGLIWLTKRTLYRGRELYARTYPPPQSDLIPAATSLPQLVTEQLLLAAARDADVEFEWGQPVAGVEVRADGVTVETERGDQFEAAYVIGADGARSNVRLSLRIPLEGPRTENAFVIVDTAEDPEAPLPAERIFHYEHPAVGRRNVLFVPFAGHWRVDLQCRSDDDAGAFSGIEGVRNWLPTVMDPKYAERVTWVSTYVFLQVLAREFADPARRVLLVGEAAHLFAPFGARGLNSGIPDAIVAARAIRAALDAQTQEEARAAVTHFAESRRKAAERNRAASNEALAHLSPASTGAKLKRRAAAVVAPRVESAGRWLDAGPYGPRLGPPDDDGMQY